MFHAIGHRQSFQEVVLSLNLVHCAAIHGLPRALRHLRSTVKTFPDRQNVYFMPHPPIPSTSYNICFYIVFKCSIASIGFIIMCFVCGFSNSSTSPRVYNDEVSEDELNSFVFITVNVGYLILSSTLGIIVGDVLWLEALCILGAKHVIVIDSIKPLVAAVLGRMVLDEVSTSPAWGGMFLTTVGVGVVAWEEQTLSTSTKEVEEEKVTSDAAVDSTVEQMEDSAFRTESNNECDENDVTHEEQTKSQSIITQSVEYQNVSGCNSMKQINYKRGYVCAIVNILADSLGSLITKKYGVGMTTWSINLIRFGFAGIVLVGISAGMRLKQRLSRSGKNYNDACPTPQWFELPLLTRRGWFKITTGVGLVTFLCPALSNYSLLQIALGLAVSLGSVGPLYGLMLDWPFKGKKPTLHGYRGVFCSCRCCSTMPMGNYKNPMIDEGTHVKFTTATVCVTSSININI